MWGGAICAAERDEPIDFGGDLGQFGAGQSLADRRQSLLRERRILPTAHGDGGGVVAAVGGQRVVKNLTASHVRLAEVLFSGDVERYVGVVCLAAAGHCDVEGLAVHTGAGDEVGGVDGGALRAMDGAGIAEFDMLGDVARRKPHSVALPDAFTLAAAVVVTQTLVEVIGMVIYVRTTPLLIPEPGAAAAATRLDQPGAGSASSR